MFLHLYGLSFRLPLWSQDVALGTLADPFQLRIFNDSKREWFACRSHVRAIKKLKHFESFAVVSKYQWKILKVP